MRLQKIQKSLRLIPVAVVLSAGFVPATALSQVTNVPSQP